MTFVIELSLDSAKAVLVTNFSNDIDTDSAAIETLHLRPVRIGPSVFELLRHLRVGLEKLDAQALEIRAFFALGLRSVPITGQQFTDSSHKVPQPKSGRSSV